MKTSLAPKLAQIFRERKIGSIAEIMFEWVAVLLYQKLAQVFRERKTGSIAEIMFERVTCAVYSINLTFSNPFIPEYCLALLNK